MLPVSITMVVVPLYKKIAFLLSSPLISGHRVRALMLSATFVTLLAWFILAVPFPYATRAEGVVWPPGSSLLRVGTDGFCRRILVPSNSRVKRGDPILVSEDPRLMAEKKTLENRLLELEARYFSIRYKDRVQADFHKEEMVSVKARLERVLEMGSRLIIRSPSDGILILPRAEDMRDRFLTKGELLGYVVEFPMNTVRVVVPQDEIGLVREQTFKVEARLAERINSIFQAEILREVPAATEQLPSMALGFAGGGAVAVDPTDDQGTKAFESVFQLDLQLPDQANIRRIGERVYIRFDHGKIPLAKQWYRSLRQLLLRRFDI